MIDYILTVAVSVSAGIDNLVSAIPILRPLTIELHLVFIFILILYLDFILMIANLRGVKESGQIFIVPTYVSICSIFVLIGTGLYSPHAP